MKGSTVIKGRWMDPVCFTIGSRPIYWYGVFMALAFGAAVTHWNLLARRVGRPPDIGFELSFWIMLAGLVGSRAAYVISEWPDLRDQPLEWLRVDKGGLIFYGGFVGALLAVWALASKRREPFWELADFVITPIPLGQALGRIGCLLNGCCYGVPSTVPWAVWMQGAHRHPTPLYESVASLLIYAILLGYTLQSQRSGRRQPGRTVGLYCLLYPFARFCIEFVRGDERMRWGSLSVAQWLSLGLLVLGAALWLGLLQSTARRSPPTDAPR